MKISKERLVQIIKEELEDAGTQFSASDLKQTIGASAGRTKARDTGDQLAGSDAINSRERNIISKMMDLLEIASVELDIDKGNAYTILERAYLLIAQVVQKEKEQQS